jgi:hypothetical protein
MWKAGVIATIAQFLQVRRENCAVNLNNNESVIRVLSNCLQLSRQPEVVNRIRISDDQVSSRVAIREIRPRG